MQLKVALRRAEASKSYWKFAYSWNGSNFMIYVPKDQVEIEPMEGSMTLDFVEYAND
jgi:hypothetical protein